MKIFDFICLDPDCQHIFEAFVKDAESLPIDGCPECGHKQTKKLPSSVAGLKVPGGYDSSFRSKKR